MPGAVHDDPWKGVFGGQSIGRALSRILSAEVKALGNTPGWYGVTLSVSALPGAVPLEGTVRFFLHDSFVNDRPLVRVVAGQAVLHLKPWGAFTVGALAEEGTCRLEPDLAGPQSATDGVPSALSRSRPQNRGQSEVMTGARPGASS